MGLHNIMIYLALGYLIFIQHQLRVFSQNCRFRNVTSDPYTGAAKLFPILGLPDSIKIGQILRNEVVDGILYRVEMAANSTKYITPEIVRHANTKSNEENGDELGLGSTLGLSPSRISRRFRVSRRSKTPSPTSTVAFRPTLDFTNYLDYVRQETLYLQIVIYCGDGYSRAYSWAISFVDTNNRAPSFNTVHLSIANQLPWSSYRPINFYKPLIASDHDYELRNGNLSFSVASATSALVPPSAIAPIWIYAEISFVPGGDRPSSYTYTLKLLLDPSQGVGPGSYKSKIRANDGVHTSDMIVELLIVPPYHYHNDNDDEEVLHDPLISQGSGLYPYRMYGLVVFAYCLGVFAALLGGLFVYLLLSSKHNANANTNHNQKCCKNENI